MAQTTIETLVGVVHSGGLRHVIFSRSLAHLLADLKPGTKVGLEYHPNVARPRKVGEDTVFPDHTTIGYWTQLAEVCRDYGLHVAFLEQPSIWDQHAEALNREARAMQELVNLDYQVGESEFQQLRRQLMAYQLEATYLFEVSREAAMVEEMANQQPEVVIVGRDHADIWMAQPGLLTEKGVQVNTFKREGVPKKEERHLTVQARMHREAQSDGYVLLERKLLLRRRDAFRLQRVCPDRTPAFIGTWSVTVPPEGLFEVFLDHRGANGQVTGVIEDTLGTATLEGTITPTQLKIVKTYVPGESMGNGLMVIDPKPVVYEGSSQDGVHYQGMYLLSTGEGGRFSWEVFSPEHSFRS